MPDARSTIVAAKFNVARFTRDLAMGKVAKKLGDELPPNQLRVAVGAKI